MNKKITNFGHLNHLPISTLAAKQQSQGKLNNCVFHTIATIMNIRFNWEINGTDLAKEFDDAWWKTPFRYRMWPNWATAPFQARRVFHKKARDLDFPLQCRLGRFSDQYLINTLRYSPNRYPIVTFIWFKDRLYLKSKKNGKPYPMQSAPGIGAHTMLLAAYNPEHRDEHGIPHPWGFVNSWVREPLEDIFWMSEETWQNTKKLRTLMVILK
jgi:hypothetical protein